MDYLNNSNIWIAGMPSFEIDHKAGDLKISMTNKEKVATYVVPLGTVSATLSKDHEVAVVIQCVEGDLCLFFDTGTLEGQVKSLSLVMRSSFGDDDYTTEYLEKGGKVADAINYLHRFYKE